MGRRPVSSKLVLVLITGGVALPIVISVLAALAALLSGMGDAVGGLVLRYAAVAVGIVWAVVLIGLVLVQGLNSLDDRSDTDE